MTTARIRGCVSVLVFTLLLGACTPPPPEPKPPEIAYGRDMCDVCGMIISEPRFAAAVVTTDGKTLKFDDVVEMFSFEQRHPDTRVRAWFVHDYNSQNWTNGETAWYVTSPEIKSPMGGGIAAFADQPSAEMFANRHGAKAMSFEEIKVAKPTMGPKM